MRNEIIEKFFFFIDKKTGTSVFINYYGENINEVNYTLALLILAFL
jgi:hypothetical protein